MIKTNNYKLYKKVNLKYNRFTSRIFKFKRAKWLVIQSKISFFKRRRVFSLKKNDPYSLGVFFNRTNIKNYCRLKYRTRHQLYYKYDRKYCSKYFVDLYKKRFTKHQLLIKSLCVPYFRVDLLLKELNFFSSVYSCKQVITTSKILLNGVILSKNKLVKKGDILTFIDSFFINSKRINERIRGQKFIFSFIEIDYYTKTIVIVKDFYDLSIEDIYLLVNHKIEIPYLVFK